MKLKSSIILSSMWDVTYISIAVYVVITLKTHSFCSEDTQKEYR